MRMIDRLTPVALLLAAVALLGQVKCLLAQDAPMEGTVPTSQPTPGVPEKSAQELQAEFVQTTRQLQAIIPPSVLSNPDKRLEFASQAIPVLYHRLQVVDQLAATKLLPPVSVIKMRSVTQALLYLLEDAATKRKVDDMIASNDPARKLAGQLIQVNAHWIGAGVDKSKQAAIADEVEKLDRANPADLRLTQLTLSFADGATSPEVETRLLHLVLEVMTDPLARTQKPGIKSQLDAEAKQQQFVNEPVVIAGKTIDGDDFSSAGWKGKVVLVDFWATWCAPCRAELPHVLETYNQYHSRGLEIVGVSSDTTAKPVQDFLSQSNFPWPELFDSQTAVLKLHPICAQFQITGLPTMYLIDKRGVLRSVNGWKQMDEMIPALLAEAAPSTQSAK